MRFYLEFDYQRISIILTYLLLLKNFGEGGTSPFPLGSNYVYISFGGNRKGVRRMYLALFATMALGGTWHGASFNFLLWGIVHGIILILHRILSGTRQNIQLKERFTKTHFLISWFVTQYLVFLTWLIFRVQDTALLFLINEIIPSFGDFGIYGHVQVSTRCQISNILVHFDVHRSAFSGIKIRLFENKIIRTVAALLGNSWHHAHRYFHSETCRNHYFHLFPILISSPANQCHQIPISNNSGSVSANDMILQQVLQH